MKLIRAKCLCPIHGKLDFDEIVIKDHTPLCAKCHSVLDYCDVRPRFDVNGGQKSKK